MKTGLPYARIAPGESQNSLEQLKRVIFVTETSKGVRREHVTSSLQCRACKYALYVYPKCHIYMCCICTTWVSYRGFGKFPIRFPLAAGICLHLDAKASVRSGADDG